MEKGVSSLLLFVLLCRRRKEGRRGAHTDSDSWKHCWDRKGDARPQPPPPPIPGIHVLMYWFRNSCDLGILLQSEIMSVSVSKTIVALFCESVLCSLFCERTVFKQFLSNLFIIWILYYWNQHNSVFKIEILFCLWYTFSEYFLLVTARRFFNCPYGKTPVC